MPFARRCALADCIREYLLSSIITQNYKPDNFQYKAAASTKWQALRRAQTSRQRTQKPPASSTVRKPNRLSEGRPKTERSLSASGNDGRRASAKTKTKARPPAVPRASLAHATPRLSRVPFPFFFAGQPASAELPQTRSARCRTAGRGRSRSVVGGAGCCVGGWVGLGWLGWQWVRAGAFRGPAVVRSPPRRLLLLVRCSATRRRKSLFDVPAFVLSREKLQGAKGASWWVAPASCKMQGGLINCSRGFGGLICWRWHCRNGPSGVPRCCLGTSWVFPKW